MERQSRIRRWLSRGSRARRDAEQAAAAQDRLQLLRAAAAAGFPLAPAAHPVGYGCSCDRIGCPTPARHPISFAWQTQATTDQEQIVRWAQAHPEANFIAATGRTHDVLDVPAPAGLTALQRLDEERIPTGPVALAGLDRMLFFTATRGTPDDEDEWWPCELDCHPETTNEHPGLRWHCRGSYVLVPPARLPGEGRGTRVRWLRGPEGLPLPEPLTLLEALTDACAAYVREDGSEEAAAWPLGR